MTTLYRSIWGAESAAAVWAVEEQFLRWAEDRARAAHHPLPAERARVRASEKNRFVLRHDVHHEPSDTKVGSAVRINLVEAVGTGLRRTWARACAGGSVAGEGVEAWVWVDVEEVTDALEFDLRVERPDFVPEMLAATGAVRRDIELRSTPRSLHGEQGAEDLGELLTQHDRDVPVVVLTGTAASDRVADALAGLAVVIHADEGARAFLPQVVGADYGVSAGAMRVYLPALDPAAGSPERHRQFAPDEVGDDAAGLALDAVERFAVSRRAPRSWDHAWRRFDDAMPATDVLERMEAARVERERALEERVRAAEAEAEALLEDAVRAQDTVVELRERLNRAHGTITRLRNHLPDDGSDVPDPSPVANPRTCAEAVELARWHFSEHIDIPASATREVDDLDSHTGPRAVWAGKLWDTFRAFDAYVRACRDGFAGDLRRWCDVSGASAITVGMVAMSESETTIARGAGERTFVVDGEKVPMFAHVKVSGWRTIAPRVYFAWRPQTARIHVGTITPHLRNTLT